MTEIEFSCMQLSIAIHNEKAVERYLLTEKNKVEKAQKLWHEMAKESTQSKKIRALSHRG